MKNHFQGTRAWENEALKKMLARAFYNNILARGLLAQLVRATGSIIQTKLLACKGNFVKNYIIMKLANASLQKRSFIVNFKMI